MRASLLILVTCGLGACADLETFDFEMVLPDDAAVMRAAAVAPPAPLVALAPEVTLVATEGVTSPAWGRAARRHLGEAPGLFGDVVAGPVTAERSQQAALPVLKAIGKQ
ncbi:MAG: hypothetical protein PHS60_10640, partial [Zavarzinia sp.]|nr:hypothetical protein [Zavarzinia sp.]